MPSVTYRIFLSLEDLNFVANYGSPQNNIIPAGGLPSLSAAGSYITMPLSFQVPVTEIYNDSQQVTTSSRMEVLAIPQPSGPRGIDTYTMTQYCTVYTNFGIITFNDVKIGTNTTTTNYTSTYGNFTPYDQDIESFVITLTRTMLYDLNGAISGMYEDINIPVRE